ncbi:phosphotransferase [Ornithinibacillus sp. L9]|uniref:Phosphotransferase n=1 Tax=Ornithinibacillus caprae TaxID=2678566 RepID=A0A6N8FEQ7_9BACI|nr:phosphotransferase [Ornithinibacillus caprae]MUK88172.1 phosphotransferase [Ornithinibacillus caprae]
MTNQLLEKAILDDLLLACNKLFNFQLIDIEPIHRGWLNLKWKVITDEGVFLLKQYNRNRLKKYSIEELSKVFSYQNQLHAEGVRCPKIQSFQEQLFLESDQGERFILMEFCDGSLVKPGKLTEQQMYDFGKETALMHKLLNDGRLVRKTHPEFQAPTINNRLAYWESVCKDADSIGNLELQSLAEKQYNATRSLPLHELHLHDTGWAHRDLWVDNVLFDRNDVSAILDFDRMKYDYPQLDVGRAVLSGALDGNDLNTSVAISFIEGYRYYQPIPSMYLTNALRLLWYMESTWWIDPRLEYKTGPPKRFKEEMVWLADHLPYLHEILEHH